MDSTAWNEAYPVGTRVVLTLVDGKKLETNTSGPAIRYGRMDFVRVEAMQGLVVLDWVKPITES